MQASKPTLAVIPQVLNVYRHVMEYCPLSLIPSYTAAQSHSQSGPATRATTTELCPREVTDWKGVDQCQQRLMVYKLSPSNDVYFPSVTCTSSDPIKLELITAINPRDTSARSRTR
ncbi:hypothetical protein BaRGS_00039663 [Batillaria attramentaria]|uniref:Uncharacterized protein n=1 Tax=Batillaria attramentaria TaxID=370345 RepID=A0ABD0J281_9CAEN